MVPYYPARDGYPSMFEPEDAPGATGATKLHRSFVDRLLADRFPMPRSSRSVDIRDEPLPIICRHESFGTISTWSAALPEYNGHRAADFWFWFNERSQRVIFSLAPAHSLTIIDYQTFVQDGKIEACIFDDPTNEIPVCGSHLKTVVKNRPRFVPAMHESG